MEIRELISKRILRFFFCVLSNSIDLQEERTYEFLNKLITVLLSLTKNVVDLLLVG